MPNKEFKIIILKILRELQKNTEKQFNCNKKIIQEDKQFSKERENKEQINFGTEEYNN